MRLTKRQVDIVNALYSANKTLAEGTDDERRKLTKMINEQICFEFGPRWGMKARENGNINNASKDSIAFLEDNGTISVWDWQNGTTRKPQIHEGDEPDYPNLPTTEAKFIPVDPVDHLRNSPPSNGDDNNDDTKDDIKTILANQVQIAQILADISQTQSNLLEVLKSLVARQFPEYEAKLGPFGSIVLKPRK